MVAGIVGLIILLIMSQKGFGSTMKNTANFTVGDWINFYSKIYNVPTALIKAIIENESSYNQYSKNPNDPSYGLMGVMPIVFYEAGLCKDYNNPTEEEIKNFYDASNNIRAGTKLLAKLYHKYELIVAIQMYNVGERGYNELGYRNSTYLNKVIDDYSKYLGEENV